MQQIQGSFTQHELTQVLDEWPKDKAPGLDGYTGEFLLELREILTSDIITTFNHVITTPGQTLHPLNDSYIVLIPKKTLTEVKDYKPISLLNSIQKCFSKLLTNQMQTII
jgi:hypothetical protein